MSPMKNPKFKVAASTTKNPKTTFSRFIRPSSRQARFRSCCPSRGPATGVDADPGLVAGSGLLRGGPAALPAGLLLLRRRPALAGVAAGARLLAAVARRVRRVGDAGGALLGHALVLERLVL